MSINKRALSLAAAAAILFSGSAFAAKNYEIVLKDYVKPFTASAAVYYTETKNLNFEQSNAFLDSINVRKGEEVKAGDTVATFTRKNDMAGRRLLEINLERMISEYEKTASAQRKTIEERQAEISLIDDQNARKVAQLELDLLNSEYNQYCYNQENAIADLRAQIEEEAEDMDDTGLESDFDGEVTWVTYLKNGQQVHSWDTVVTLTNKNRMLLCVEDSNASLHYGMTVNITCGSNAKNAKQQTLTGRVIVSDSILQTEQKTGYSFISLDEPLNDPDVRMIKVSANAEYVENVVVVPNKAVSMSHGSMLVTIVEDGIEKERYVNRAQFHGTDAWILQGLEEGQTILVNN